MGLQTERLFLWILLALIVGLLLAWGNWHRSWQIAIVTSQAHSLGLIAQEQAARLGWEYLATGTVNELLVSIGVRVQERAQVVVVSGALRSTLGRVMIRPLSHADSALRSARRILSGDSVFDASFLMLLVDAEGRPLPGDPLNTDLATATPIWVDEAVRNRVSAIGRLQAMLVVDESVSVRIENWNSADLNTAVELVAGLGRWPNGRADGVGYR